MKAALDDLKQYIHDNGPFEAVLAFSQGATLAATFIAYYGVEYFKCAVFICGGIRGLRAKLMSELGEVTIPVSTGHILGIHDDLYAAGVELSELCSKGNRLVMAHDGGHEVPKGEGPLAEMARLVEGVIARSLFAQ